MGVSEVSVCSGMARMQVPSARLLAAGQVVVLYGAGGVRTFCRFGKNTKVPDANVASAMVRLRYRYPSLPPYRGVKAYSSSAKFVFSSCFRNRLTSKTPTSGPDEELCTGVPATPPVGVPQAAGNVAVDENTFAGTSRLALKKEHSEARNSAGSCQLE